MPVSGSSDTDVATEIMSYFVAHPEAQDTIEGIIEWWLLERQICRESARVKSALRDLVSSGLVIEQQGGDGKVRYRANRERLADMQALLTKKRMAEGPGPAEGTGGSEE